LELPAVYMTIEVAIFFDFVAKMLISGNKWFGVEGILKPKSMI
jgi:hypothetical protein